MSPTLARPVPQLQPQPAPGKHLNACDAPAPWLAHQGGARRPRASHCCVCRTPIQRPCATTRSEDIEDSLRRPTPPTLGVLVQLRHPASRSRHGLARSRWITRGTVRIPSASPATHLHGSTNRCNMFHNVALFLSVPRYRAWAEPEAELWRTCHPRFGGLLR